MAPLMNERKLLEGEIAEQVIAANYTCPNDGFHYAWIDDTDPTIIWYLDACPIDPIVTTVKNRIKNVVTAAYTQSATETIPYKRVKEIVKTTHTQLATWIQNNVDETYEGYISAPKRLRGWIIDELRTQAIIGP
jgi:hypothetical protein